MLSFFVWLNSNPTSLSLIAFVFLIPIQALKVLLFSMRGERKRRGEREDLMWKTLKMSEEGQESVPLRRRLSMLQQNLGTP